MDKNITYHANDVLMKVYGEIYKDQALDVYGLRYPRIKCLLPSNFPQIKADERRADNVFLLEDDSILLLEYESRKTLAKNQLKYCDYILRIVNRHLRERRKLVKVHVAVVYASNITHAPDTFEVGDLLLKTQNVFLKHFDGEQVYREMADKIGSGTPLEKCDIMKLSLTPLMNNKVKRQTMIRRNIELAQRIDNADEQLAVIAGVLTVTDKIIDEAYSTQVREWLRMLKVSRIYQREKEEAIEQAVKQAVEQAVEQAAKQATKQAAKQQEQAVKQVIEQAEQARKEQTRQIARNFLEVLPAEEVSRRTGLSLEEVQNLAGNP